MRVPLPINIATAALVMQFSIILIMALGVAALSIFSGVKKVSGVVPIILFLAILSIGFLMFSDPLYSTWAPLFGSNSIGGLKWSLSLLVVFILDISAVALLVWLTGGSMNSVFTPIYFMLPPMGIFLREPGQHILAYLLLTMTLFSSNFWSYYAPDWRWEEGRKVAFWLVSILCFLLATYTGYVTRPQ